jgi:hypothetical protein
MPSTEHDIVGRFFREHPAFAAQLLSGLLGLPLPHYDEARTESIDFTDVQPTPYFADAAVSLVVRRALRVPHQRRARRRRRRPDPAVRGIAVEVQRGRDPHKRRSWPVYVATFSALLGCPVTLLVIATREDVARWAAKPIKFGEPDGLLRPVVLGPGQIPAIVDPEAARQNPELAVLSARVHGNTPEAGAVFAALLAALKELDQENAQLYYDLVLDGLEPWAQDALKELTTVTAVVPNDPRAVNLRRLIEGAWASGEAKGEARAVLAFLSARGIEVPDDARERITECTDPDQLEVWVRRAAIATTVKELFE